MFRNVMAIGGILAMLVGAAPPALAEPPSTPADAPAPPDAPAPGSPSTDAATTVIPWADLGTDNRLSFYGNSGTISLSIPVPSGLAPVALNATLDLPFNLRSGVISVTQDTQLISKVGRPLADLAPLVIPLPGVRIVDKTVDLTLTLSAVPDDGYCLDERSTVDLINGSVTFAGTDVPPATVADFLPPILRKATIAVPGNPSPAEADAAVALAAQLSATYRQRSQPTQVVVAPLAGDQATIDTPSIPMERVFIVKEGPDNGLSLVGSGGIPQLRISGPANKLKNAARLLTNGALNLAVSTNVVTGDLRSDPRFPGNATTLAALGRRVITAAGAAPQVTIYLDQTKFGHSIQGVRVHVQGSYTPVPSAFGGQVTVSIAGEPLESWPAEPSGVIDRWIAVPDRLVGRSIALTVAVNTTGNEGRCNEFRPVVLTVLGSSVVETTPANPPIPSGFRSLPQALMPQVQVGIGQNSFPDLARAIQIVTGLQRITDIPLITQVTSVKQALDSGAPAIIVSADGWNQKSITLPLSSSDRTITLSGAGNDPKAALTLDPGAQFGSLQTVFDGQRSLLVATSTGSPAQLDDLLRWLDADPRRWSDLNSNVLVAFPGREPVEVSGREPLTVFGPPASDADLRTGSYRPSSAWWAAGAILLAAAVGFGAIIGSARRGRNDPGTSHRRG